MMENGGTNPDSGDVKTETGLRKLLNLRSPVSVCNALKTASKCSQDHCL